MLAERVENGDLPPLKKRLPNNPVVVEPAEKPGRYGGTFVSASKGPGDEASFDRIASYQPPLRKDAMLEDTLPNLCESVRQSDDGTQVTLKLREGMRWSDGEPFTADDMLFALEEVLGNEEITPAPPGYLSHDGKLAKGEARDNYTFVLTYPEPQGLFMEEITTQGSQHLTRYPAHYVRDFLPKFNDNLDRDAEAAGFSAWTEYFTARVAAYGPYPAWENPDLPTLLAWVVVNPLSKGSKTVLERNPYFWKTDPDGRQLPYIDRLEFQTIQEDQVLTLKGTDGQLDLIYRHVNGPSNKPVFARSREKGDYRLIETRTTAMNAMCIALNLAHQNKAKRELYQNRDFRVGLSHAIDRKELITAVWQRQGEPWQAAPAKDSEFYDEEFAKQYTEYDVQEANRRLDRAGLTDRDSDNFRLMPNGDRLTVSLDIAAAYKTEWPAAADIIQKMWGEVGVRMQPNTIDRTLFYERKTWDSNKHDAGCWNGDGGLAVEIIDPRWYMPFTDESVWATPWAQWFQSKGEEGTKPPEAPRRQIELYWQIQRTADAERRADLFREILRIAKEEFFVLGVCTAPDPYLVAKNRLRNVVENMPDSWQYLMPSPSNPESWYLEDD